MGVSSYHVSQRDVLASCAFCMRTLEPTNLLTRSSFIKRDRVLPGFHGWAGRQACFPALTKQTQDISTRFVIPKNVYCSSPRISSFLPGKGEKNERTILTMQK